MDMPATTNSFAPTDLKTLPTEQLMQLLVDVSRETAERMVFAAQVYMELESRGVNMAPFRTGIGRYWRAIAANKLAPEAVMRLAGNSTVLNALQSLPLAEQRRVLDEGVLRVVKEVNQPAVEVPLMAATTHDVNRAIDPVRGVVVEPNQQRVGMPRAKVASVATRPITVRFTEDEYRKLQLAATRHKKAVVDLIRMILQQDGVFK